MGGITAARLHGLWLPSAAAGEKLEFVITGDPRRPRDLAHSRRNEIVTRRRALRRDEIIVSDRFALVSPTRAWIDLCETLSLADAVAAGDSILHQRLGSLGQLQDAVRRRTGGAAFASRGRLCPC